MLALDLVSGVVLLVLWPGDARSSADVAGIAAQPAYLLVSFVLGTLTTAIGGGVCARTAPKLPYWNAAAFAGLSVAVGLLLSDPAQPWWFTTMAVLITVPAALYGAYRGLNRSA